MKKSANKKANKSNLAIFSNVCRPFIVIRDLTQPRCYEDAVDALDGLTDAGHHWVDLLGQVVLCVHAETLLLLQLLQSVRPLTGC